MDHKRKELRHTTEVFRSPVMHLAKRLIALIYEIYEKL